MNDTQINQAIAKYMGTSINEDTGMLVTGRVGTSIDPSAVYLDKPYTQSLDALVPVVEKLKLTEFNIQRFDEEWVCCVYNIGETKRNFSMDTECEPTPSKALASACYQVIKDQNENS